MPTARASSSIVSCPSGSWAFCGFTDVSVTCYIVTEVSVTVGRRGRVQVVRRRIVAEHLRQTGRHDQVEVYGGPPGDPGLLGPGSMSWELHSDVAAVAIGGVAAIVMDILHPSVMAGVHVLYRYLHRPL